MQKAGQYSVEMESRLCGTCNRKFKVAAKSTQIFCSQFCSYQGAEKCLEPRKDLNAGAPKIASVTVSAERTQLFEKPKKRGKGKTAQKTSSENARGIVDTTPNIQKNETQSELSGPAIIASEPSPTKGNIMPKTATDLSPRSESAAGETTPPEDSTEQSLIVRQALSQSMNSVDDTAKHLFGLMTGLFANQPPAEVRVFDTERVRTACNCASEIRGLMKLKLDAAKFLHEVRSSV